MKDQPPSRSLQGRLLMLVLVMLIPGIATWLPALMLGK